jgi:hypothetical protein
MFAGASISVFCLDVDGFYLGSVIA